MLYFSLYVEIFLRVAKSMASLTNLQNIRMAANQKGWGYLNEGFLYRSLLVTVPRIFEFRLYAIQSG